VIYNIIYYKLHRLLTVYMGSYTRLELIWPRAHLHCQNYV